jgi:hypothetical protein
LAGGAELDMIKQFFRYMFVSRTSAEEWVEVVDEVPEPVTGYGVSPDVERRARAGVMVMVSWVFALVLVVGFGYIIATNLLRPTIPTPEIISNILWAIIGYFGGAFTVFVGNRPAAVRPRAFRKGV